MIYRAAVLVLGLLIAAYWGRVMRIAIKRRRRTGRSANFFPREKIGLSLRVVWIPLVLIWVLHPFVTSIFLPREFAVSPIWMNSWAAWAGVVVVGVCLAASIACWRTMGRNWRMGIDPEERTDLVVTGPFARVRHPIYALSQMMMLASAAAIASPLMLAAAAIHICLLQWEARREETHLLRVHGQAYEEYCRRVPRFIASRWSA